jgi:hypothetical protein
MGKWGKTLTPLFGRSTNKKLVKDVERSFIFRLTDGTTLFEKVRFDICTGDVTAGVEIDTDELSLL